MRFIKNKRTNRAKWLLTSSVLILNGNGSCFSNITPQSDRKDLTSTLYSPIMTPSGKVKLSEELNRLQTFCFDLIECCEKLNEDIANKRVKPFTDNQQQDDEGYESDDEDKDENENKNNFIYGVPSRQPGKDTHDRAEQPYGTTRYRNGIPVTDL